MTNNNKPQQEPETTVNPSSAAVTPPTAPDKQDSPAPNQPAAKKPWTVHQLKLRRRNQTRKGKSWQAWRFCWC